MLALSEHICQKLSQVPKPLEGSTSKRLIKEMQDIQLQRELAADPSMAERLRQEELEAQKKKDFKAGFLNALLGKYKKSQNSKKKVPKVGSDLAAGN